MTLVPSAVICHMTRRKIVGWHVSHNVDQSSGRINKIYHEGRGSQFKDTWRKLTSFHIFFLPCVQIKQFRFLQNLNQTGL